MRRTPSLFVALCFALLPLLALGCSDATAPEGTAPDAELAKGGEKGPPDKDGGGGGGGGAKGTPSLDEFWVEADAAGPDLVHIVASATDPDGVTPAVGHDYFFNGEQDDDYSDHYEYFWYQGVETSVTTSETLADGRLHLDFTWDGSQAQGLSFRDRPHTSVGGTGADPFHWQFELRNDKERAGVTPRGVVVDGETVGAEATVPARHGHAGGDVTSFAVHDGGAPEGTVSVAELTASNLSCTLERTRIGKGKDARWVEEAVVTGDLHVRLDRSDGRDASAWVEFHWRDAATGTISSRETFNTDAGTIDASMSGSFSGASPPASVELVLDYVETTNGSTDTRAFVYDAGENADTGFATTVPAATTSPSDDPAVPEAATSPVSVDCS